MIRARTWPIARLLAAALVISAGILPGPSGAAGLEHSAGTRPPDAQFSRSAPRLPVLFFVSDGGRPDLFRQYAAQGQLPAFARLEAEGAVAASGMLPQLPTSSRAGWQTLSTGAWPGTHGAVNNVYARSGQPMSDGLQFGQRGGLEAETLAEAAERAGRRVLMFDWNSSDQPAIAGPTVSYWDTYSLTGIAQSYPDPAAAESSRAWGLMFDLLEITPAARPVSGPSSFSPPWRAELRLFDSAGPSYRFTVFFADGLDDGQANYDRAVVVQNGETLAEVGAGGWAEIRVRIANGPARGKAAGFYLKLMELSPDLERVKFFVTAVSRVQASPPELADLLAERFPTRAGADGSTVWARLIDEDTYAEAAGLTTAFNIQALPWLLGEYAPDTDLALVGYINTDIIHHANLALITPGTPVYDDADRDGRPDGRLAARRRQELQAYQGADRTLAAAWEAMPPETVVFAASDHGFAPIWRAVFAPQVLAAAGLQPEPQFGNCSASERVLAKACWAGGMAMIYLNVRGREPEGVVPPEDYLAVRRRVVAAWQNLRDEGGHPVAAAVFTREEAAALPDGWSAANLSHPDRTGDVIVFLNLPYQFDFAEGAAPFRDMAVWWGAHGHLPQSGRGVPNADLYAAFYAAGPAIRRRQPERVRAIDLAPTIAHLLGIPAPAQAEGRVLWEILTGRWACRSRAGGPPPIACPVRRGR